MAHQDSDTESRKAVKLRNLNLKINSSVGKKEKNEQTKVTSGPLNILKRNNGFDLTFVNEKSKIVS